MPSPEISANENITRHPVFPPMKSISVTPSRSGYFTPLMGWSCYGIGACVVPRSCLHPPSHQLTMLGAQ
jgi:hypothetical protein